MLKKFIWKAAKSTYSQAREREMKGMRKVSEEAFKHMMVTPPRFWSKSMSFVPLRPTTRSGNQECS